jgi:hypothetical protein
MKNSTKKLATLALIGVPAFAMMACAPVDADEETAGKHKAGDGAPGEVGNWNILNEPKFGKQYGMFDTVKIDVKNVSASEDEPWLEIRLTNKAGDLVTTFDCLGDTVEPGQKTTLKCSSFDDYAPFADYEIKNAL